VWLARQNGLAMVRITVFGPPSAAGHDGAATRSEQKSLVRNSPGTISPSDSISSNGLLPPDANAARTGNRAPRPAWWQVIAVASALLWAIGIAWGLFRLAWGCVALARFRRRLEPLSDARHKLLVRQAADAVGLRELPKVLLSHSMGVPVSIGFLRPIIVLPKSVLHETDGDQLQAVLLHEMAHIARRDHWVGIIQRLAAALYWWNPLVHAACNEISDIREEICDTHVMLVQGEGRHLAHILVDLAARVTSGPLLPSAIGAIEPRLAGLAARVTRLLDKERKMETRMTVMSKMFMSLGWVAVLAGMASVGGLRLVNAQPPTEAKPAEQVKTHSGKPDASKGVWVVKFEPVGDFAPKTPTEFLSKIHVYSGQDGQIGYFRTKAQGDKLIGSFLAYDGDQLKAALAKIPEIKVISVKKLTQEQLDEYVKLPQENLIGIDFEHLDASKGVWVVRFEPVGDFAPKTPKEFLSKIHVYSGQEGEIGYFRTKAQGDKLIGSFLAYDGDQLKAALSKIPELKVISVEKLTQEQLDEYEKLPQESLNGLDFEHLDASKGVWVVKFEPVGDFAPKTPSEFLSKIHVYSGQDGEIGYFRTKVQGDKLIGSFLAYDGDQLKAALSKIPELKVTSVEKLTQEQLDEYEKLPQESLPTAP
jgi:beta-lactamase regulating signal transducer with metallopeptidase domain